jgi:hypothetical protein
MLGLCYPSNQQHRFDQAATNIKQTYEVLDRMNSALPSDNTHGGHYFISMVYHIDHLDGVLPKYSHTYTA